MEQQNSDKIFNTLFDIYGKEFNDKGFAHFKALQKEREIEREQKKLKEKELTESRRYVDSKRIRRKLI